MSSLNKVTLIGNLGQDPEVKYLEGGKVVAKFSLATTESYKNAQGEKISATEWHSLELWDGIAKVAEQYLKKGARIYAEGKIKTDTWTNDSGENRKSVKIRVQNMIMLSGGHSDSNADQSSGHSSMSSPSPGNREVADEDEDLPF